MLSVFVCVRSLDVQPIFYFRFWATDISLKKTEIARFLCEETIRRAQTWCDMPLHQGGQPFGLKRILEKFKSTSISGSPPQVWTSRLNLAKGFVDSAQKSALNHPQTYHCRLWWWEAVGNVLSRVFAATASTKRKPFDSTPKGESVLIMLPQARCLCPLR